MGRPSIPYCKQFSDQKQNARRRGIQFEFDYNTWISWWGDDIKLRGRGKGTLVMARKKDQGAYHPDNVVKLLNEENIRQGNCGKIVTEETRKKLSTISHLRWIKEKEEQPCS